MKRESKILLRIIFLLTVLFCPGIIAYSNQNIQTTIIEHPVVENSVENNLFSDVDFFDDEQVNPISYFFPGANYVYQIRIPPTCILISRYPTSIWQPPKSK